MKVTGKMTCNMDLGRKYGQTIPGMKESILKGRNMEREHMCGQMEVNTKATGLKIE